MHALTEDMKSLLKVAFRIAPEGQNFVLEELPLPDMSHLARTDCAFALAREPLRYLDRKVSGATAAGQELPDPPGSLYALSKLGRPIAKQLIADERKECEVHPRAPEPDREFTVQQAIEMCTTAISTYRINRRQLVEVYKALNQMGDQWQPKCERDSRTGVLRIRFGAYDIGDDGKFLAAGIITDTNPYAPFYNFRLLDSSGNVPGPGTAASAVQNKMAYFMDETRNAALVLSQLLPQLGTIAPTLGVDPTPLTKLRHRLAPFPYVPVRNQTTEIKEAFRAIGPSNVAIGPATIRTDDVPGFTPASRDKEIADDEPFFVDAKVALEHLLQAHWRAARALTGEFKESDGNMSGAPNPHGLLWLVERAKNVSPLHRALYGISLVVVVLIIVFGVIGDWKWALFGGVSILVVTILWNIVGSPRSHHANFAKWIVVGAFGVFVAMALVKLGVVLFAH